MFKKNVLFLGFLSLLLSLPFQITAQSINQKLSQRLQSHFKTIEAQETIAAFIYFKDKGNNVNAKLAQAEEALSPKALQRRIINRGADNAVDFSDIPVNPAYIKLIEAKVTKIRHEIKLLNAVSVEATSAALAKIADFKFVEKVDIVAKVRVSPDPVVDPATLKDLEAMEVQPKSAVQTYNYGDSYTQNNQINVPAVHDLGYDGSGVIIGIFDSGFNLLEHEAFNHINIAGTQDFVNGGTDVDDGTGRMGVGNHGTNTLSVIGGFREGSLIGPAFGATYYLAKTENTESELHVEEDNWCAAAEWVEAAGAQIITSSLSYSSFDVGQDYTPSDMDGDTAVVTICADHTASLGVVIVNSAGNDGSSSQNTLGAPSDGDFVLAAGAVTSSGSRSSFSSVGLSADGRIKPDVMAMGSSVRAASSSSSTGYTYVNGTSFSCPLTAGVAALVIQSAPNLTATEVRDILRNTADNVSSPDKYYGYGIIDAFAAVQAAGGITQYTLTHSTVGDGAIALNPSGGTYVSGTVVTVTGNPTSGWSFSDWSGDLTGSVNPTTITMDEDKSITATFTEGGPVQYTLTTSTVGQGSVTLNPSGGSYGEGTVVTVTASPDTSWLFSAWSGDLSGSVNPESITMNSNKSVTATFTEDPKGSCGVNPSSDRANVDRTFLGQMIMALIPLGIAILSMLTIVVIRRRQS